MGRSILLEEAFVVAACVLNTDRYFIMSNCKLQAEWDDIDNEYQQLQVRGVTRTRASVYLGVFRQPRAVLGWYCRGYGSLWFLATSHSSSAYS